MRELLESEDEVWESYQACKKEQGLIVTQLDETNVTVLSKPPVSTPSPANSNFSGVWGGGAVISVEGNSLTIDMSIAGHPQAKGKINPNNPLKAEVNFPDDKTHTATLVSPDRIIWSNGTYWNRSQ